MKVQRNHRERGIAIYATAVFLALAIPMVGLAIDTTLLYIVKTRLQGSVDGAALAAARALSRGSDDSSQQQSAKDAAATYVRLNFPSSFFFSNDIVMTEATDVTVDVSVLHQRTVTVNAQVTEPTLFMRWLNFSSTLVKANATTVRKDVNVVLVLDRSGSMTASGSCDPMKQAAINFIGNFAPGRDEVGIISFATTVLEQMPVTATFKAADGTGSGTDPRVAINGIQCQGSTNSASALWAAYNELIGLNQAAALNFIVFFTDGEPTASNMNMPITVGSPCSVANPSVASGGTPPTGLPSGYVGKYRPGTYAVTTDGSTFIGLAASTASPNANGTPPSSTLPSINDQVVAPNSTGCAYANSWPSNWTTVSDFRGLAVLDMYGNDVNSGYVTVPTMSGSYISIANPGNGIPVATNAADSAARNIRTGANMTVLSNVGSHLNGVIIHSIGLGNASVPLAADNTFLSRVSNIPSAPGYDSNYASGIYEYVQQSSDLGNAFNQIASEILRLSR